MLSSVGFCSLNLLHIITDFLRKFWIGWARMGFGSSQADRSIYFKMASYLHGTLLNNPLYVLCFRGLITSESELFLQLSILDPPLTFWTLFTPDLLNLQSLYLPSWCFIFIFWTCRYCCSVKLFNLLAGPPGCPIILGWLEIY